MSRKSLYPHPPLPFIFLLATFILNSINNGIPRICIVLRFKREIQTRNFDHYQISKLELGITNDAKLTISNYPPLDRVIFKRLSIFFCHISTEEYIRTQFQRRYTTL